MNLKCGVAILRRGMLVRTGTRRSVDAFAQDGLRSRRHGRDMEAVWAGNWIWSEADHAAWALRSGASIR